jgi:RNA polymerase sigma-70 factor, ECF subfamily
MSTSFQSTSSSLIMRVQAREEDAWRQFSELYAPLVYHWCRKSGLSAEDAADAVQEIFHSLISGITSYHRMENGAFRGWLFTVTRNKLTDIARSRRFTFAEGGTDFHRQMQQVTDPASLESSLSTIPALGPVVHRALAIAKAEFEARTWRVFWLTTVEGKTPHEAAEELGLTANAARQAKYRVLSRLRQLLCDELP